MNKESDAHIVQWSLHYPPVENVYNVQCNVHDTFVKQSYSLLKLNKTLLGRGLHAIESVCEL